MLALLGASGNALLAQGAAGSVRYSARPQLQPAVLGPTRCLLPSRRPQMVVSAATGPIADTSARVLFASLLPAVAVVSSCLAAMIPTGYNSFVKKHEGPDGRSPKLTRRVFTGCLLGAVVSMWIFSGAIGFLAAFAWMAVVAQNEYYFMARQNGVYPTWKLGMLGSLGMYFAAASQLPGVQEAMLPLTGTVCIVYLLLRQEPSTPPTTMTDVSTTFMGIWYLGYMPSFWIRLNQMGPLPASSVLSLFVPAAARAAWPLAAVEASALGQSLFTQGAIVQWWTMISIVSADIAAYFGGKRWGKTKLISVSPNKTWEGLISGIAGCVGMMVVGASLMRWPVPLLSGALYGVMCAVMALIGDLTVSLLKRSAKVKDTGDLLPGHGGLLDRIDSFLLVPAPAYFFVKHALPALARLA